MPITHEALTAPVREDTGEETKGPAPGIALCLSGGGYRAMLFHAGALLLEAALWLPLALATALTLATHALDRPAPASA